MMLFAINFSLIVICLIITMICIHVYYNAPEGLMGLPFALGSMLIGGITWICYFVCYFLIN
jgi:hypothetical protein